jgi:hypothetical protein
MARDGFTYGQKNHGRKPVKVAQKIPTPPKELSAAGIVNRRDNVGVFTRWHDAQRYATRFAGLGFVLGDDARISVSTWMIAGSITGVIVPCDKIIRLQHLY